MNFSFWGKNVSFTFVFGLLLASLAHANSAPTWEDSGNQDTFNIDEVRAVQALVRAQGTKDLFERINGPLPSDFNPLAVSCAGRLIVQAAKKNVEDNFDNRNGSGGKCAYGVRTSLQRSKVGNVTEGLGNAIDYLETLVPKGFIDSKWKDPKTAPVGSVIVFAGPNTDDYLRTGNMGSPAGDWVGHVTIKGDDFYYYTDGRTTEPALGWRKNRNVDEIRNVAAIFVPGPALVEQFKGRCGNASN